MSGIEFIIGTTLASIPIVLEAYDRSERVFDIFRTIRRYPREVNIFEAKLNSQRIIFRNNTTHLLAALICDRGKVEQILRDPSLYIERAELTLDPRLESRLEGLNASFKSCGQVISLIHETLDSLCAQFDAFCAEVSEKDETLTTSQWLRQVKTRFSLALSKPQIAKSIVELRNLNTDYDLLAKQIIGSVRQLSQNTTNQEPTPIHHPIRQLNNMQRYHRVRQASVALYSTLDVRWVCSAHRGHTFDIKVVDGESAAAKGKGRTELYSYVTCDLAISHDGSTPMKNAPLRIQVEQSCEAYDGGVDNEIAQSTVHDTVMGKLIASLGDLHDAPPTIQIGSKSRKRDMWKDKRQQARQRPAQEQQQIPLHPLPSLLPPVNAHNQAIESQPPDATASFDLSLVNDLCLRSQEVTGACAARSLLGLWPSPHAKWFAVPPIPQRATHSLDEMICWISEEPILRSFSRTTRIELAGGVADGLMNFYSTPWLPQSELRHAIRYFGQPLQGTNVATSGFDVTATPQDLEGPFFTLRGKVKPEPKRVVSESADSDDAPLVSDVRNRLLFSYGILLLEIGFGKPWDQLKHNVSGSVAHGPLSDYRAAEKLATLLVRQMGPRYPRIIKKCLGCDFGLGETDLDNESLQRQFVEDVVLVLKQLGEDMRQRDKLL